MDTFKIPSDFDWGYYVKINPDLIKSGITTKELAEKHFINHGHSEKRLYKRNFVDKVLKLKNKKLNSLKVKISIKDKLDSNQVILLKNFLNTLVLIDFVEIFIEGNTEILDNEYENFFFGEKYDYYDFNIIIGELDKNFFCKKSFKNFFLLKDKTYINHNLTNELPILLFNDNKDYLENFLKEESSNLIISDKLKERFNIPIDPTKPIISIITSVKNGYDFLEQLFENTLNQTIFKQCEWIIVDVNESDKDYSIIKKYLKNDNIRYYKKTDVGLYGIWNYAIKNSISNFITNFNCDDRRFENSLECQIKTILINDVDITYSDAITTTEPNITTKNFNKILNSLGPKHEYISKFINTDIGILPLWYNSDKIEDIIIYNILGYGPMWKKEIHEKIGYFDSDFKSSGDWDFFLRCYFNNFKFIKIEDVLVICFYNPNGLSTNEENYEKFIKNETSIIIERIKNNYNT